jgi:hypothetical protein
VRLTAGAEATTGLLSAAEYEELTTSAS